MARGNIFGPTGTDRRLDDAQASRELEKELMLKKMALEAYMQQQQLGFDQQRMAEDARRFDVSREDMLQQANLERHYAEMARMQADALARGEVNARRNEQERAVRLTQRAESLRAGVIRNLAEELNRVGSMPMGRGGYDPTMGLRAQLAAMGVQIGGRTGERTLQTDKNRALADMLMQQAAMEQGAIPVGTTQADKAGNSGRKYAMALLDSNRLRRQAELDEDRRANMALEARRANF